MDGGEVRIDRLRFRWRPNRPPVLDVPQLLVAGGERVFVRGASGSGKTTLLNLLGGILAPEQGSVFVGGIDLTALSAARRDAFRADNIGIVFQMFNLVPYLTLVDNVLLPCRFSRERRKRLTREPKAEARHLLAQTGLPVDELARRPVAELSVGQQQRVALARALIGRPKLILADEPTSALDPASREAFLNLLFREAAGAGATLVFVSHENALEKAFDRVLTLPGLCETTGPAQP